MEYWHTEQVTVSGGAVSDATPFGDRFMEVVILSMTGWDWGRCRGSSGGLFGAVVCGSGEPIRTRDPIGHPISVARLGMP